VWFKHDEKEKELRDVTIWRKGREIGDKGQHKGLDPILINMGSHEQVLSRGVINNLYVYEVTLVTKGN
jgi:hypothetical protein